MSRISIIIILGIGAILMVGITAVIVGLTLLMPVNLREQNAKPTLLVAAATTTETPTPTTTATATAVSPTATQPTTSGAVTATAVFVNQTGNSCTDAAAFVSDVTIPDGSQMQPGVSFVKTWRIKNSGTCTWNSHYQLVFAGNNILGSLANSFPLASTVAAGQTVDVSVALVAPTTPGTYQGDWKLQNAQGRPFGLGVNRDKPFWVKIVVSPTPAAYSGSISGYAWQDKDNDNALDANEKLPNVTITLATGAECRTVINSLKTDGNGRFTFANLSPNAYCLFGTDGSVTVSQSQIVVGQNQQLTDINVTWPPVWQPPTTISGLIYQDANQNGVYDNGETLMGSRQVRLIPGTACHVQQNPQAVAFSDGNGRYTLAGEFNGSTCVGVVDDNGSLHDVVAVTVTAGQTVNNINLKWPSANLSISGYLWDDYCLTNEAGEALAGDCVADGNGFYHADGMIQPTETYIAGVTILLQLGTCTNNNNVVVTAVTDGSGRYTFNSLQPATYCVSMNAAANGNGDKLLPGDWTFPARGIWYQEITLQAGQSAFPVNFGWDYQLK